MYGLASASVLHYELLPVVVFMRDCSRRTEQMRVPRTPADLVQLSRCVRIADMQPKIGRRVLLAARVVIVVIAGVSQPGIKAGQLDNARQPKCFLLVKTFATDTLIVAKYELGVHVVVDAFDYGFRA